MTEECGVGIAEKQQDQHQVRSHWQHYCTCAGGLKMRLRGHPMPAEECGQVHGSYTSSTSGGDTMNNKGLQQ